MGRDRKSSNSVVGRPDRTMMGCEAMSEFAIQTTGLCKRFGRLRAVNEVDLKVPAGCVYGYLGRNGAGKTTTIQMLMGFLQPTSGRISVLGFDPLREDVAMKRVVSYVPERVEMYDWMKVRETLWFGQHLHPRWDPDLAKHLIGRFELPPERRVGQLSRGMQGKLALALALSSHPQLVLLDDPTQGLDAVVRREFIESIVGILQEAGTTVFFSSHIIDDVERVADWVGILHEGKLIVQEPLEQLKASVKRVLATFPDSAPAQADGAILRQDTDGRRREIIYRTFGPEQESGLHAAGVTDIEVSDCSLEDIFIAYVGPKRGVPAEGARTS